MTKWEEEMCDGATDVTPGLQAHHYFMIVIAARPHHLVLISGGPDNAMKLMMSKLVERVSNAMVELLRQWRTQHNSSDFGGYKY